MALEGDLRIFQLPDILQMVSHQQKTGILTLQGEQDIVAVSFLKGQIVAADALNQNFEGSLGDVLASQGVLAPDAFSRLLEEHRQSGDRFADFLVRKGVLDRPRLLDALRVQTYRLLLQLLRWREGEFKFYSGEEVSFEEGFEAIPVEELLLRSIGDLMGEGTLAGTLPHGFLAYERLPAAKPVRVISPETDTQARTPDSIWLTADEKTILDRLNGKSSAERIAVESGLGEYKTLYALFRLLQSGLARPAAGQQQEPAASPAQAPEPVAAAAAPISAEPFRILGSAAAASEREEPREAAASFAEWVASRLLPWAAAALAVLLVFAITRAPAGLLWSFPWLSAERQGFEKQQRIARFLGVDRGARTFFLLSGRFPDSLEELSRSHLVPESKLSEPAGGGLQYRASAATYSVVPVFDDIPRPELGITEGIAGDFFLDPDFFGELQQEAQPVILLPE